MKALLTRVLLLTLCASILTGCGWRLRGGDSLDIQQQIYLAQSSGQIYDRLVRSLTRKQSKVELVDADVQLVLEEEFYERRSISTDNQARTRQYQLTYSINYQILDPAGKPLSNTLNAELVRYYTFDQNNINSSDKEEQALRRDMVNQIARRILQRVQFVMKNQ